MSESVWKLIGDVAFYGVGVSAALFSLLYLFFSPWYTTPTGRNIMAVMASLAAAAVYFAVIIWIGRVPAGFYPIRAFLFTSLFLAIAWRVVLLVRLQLLSRRERDSHDSRT